LSDVHLHFSHVFTGVSSVLRLLQHSIGYMGDGFYRSKDTTNSIKVLKEQIVHRQIKHTISRREHKTVCTNNGWWASKFVCLLFVPSVLWYCWLGLL